MKVLGRTDEQSAQQFVQQNPNARLGSMSSDGMRRVLTDATGDAFNDVREKFGFIAVVGPIGENNMSISSQPLPCIHRGSQRKTCCGSPNLWICRELRSDCVADTVDAERLQSMVSTQEAANIKVCSTCRVRVEPPADASAIEFINSWPPKERRIDSAHRVGFVSTAYMPIGGTETFHRSLLPRLKDAANIAGFVATGFHEGDGTKLQVTYATGIPAAQQLAAHCDVVVVWGIHDIPAILPANRPKVIAVHHADWSSDWNNRSILNQLDFIDEIVCVNQETANKLKSCGKQVHYVPNAIDPDRLAPSGKQSDLRAQFGIPEESKIVLFGHRLSSEKRPHLAIEIARKLPGNWLMVIAGTGLEEDSVKADASDCDRVRIVGACDSLADWFSISDCFLSLSTFEGFGLSIGESMAAGLPTVSTSTGIAPGLATTLPTDSTAQEWADAIINAKALVSPEVILERFSVSRMVSAWEDVIVKTHQGTLN